MQIDHSLELSVIVPVLNEAEYLADLLNGLSMQTGIRFEVIVSDAGSDAETGHRAAKLVDTCPFDLRLVRALRGRGRQMNVAAALARSPLLLFLHADSDFPARDALARAVQAFGSRQAQSERAVAGRFALRFRRQETKASLSYFFYEAKARLNRCDCIRGDQGFMLPRSLFTELGGFDESLPFLEDIRMAALIADQGEWILLPAEITSSARRFEAEGLWERQVLNAIIVNANVANWSEFFTALPGLYRCHAETGRLQLFPLLQGIHRLLRRHTLGWRLKFWRATGRHVAANSWQLFFWLDVRRAFLYGLSPGEIDPRWALFFERWVKPSVRRLPIQIAAALLIWFWHRAALIKGRFSFTPTGTS